MGQNECNAEWQEVHEDIVSGIREWRLQHPKATLGEIEAAVDERLARWRAWLLREVVMASTAVDWRAAGKEAEVRCPQCGQVLQACGEQQRTLQTHGGQEIVLKRQYGVCPGCGQAFFPSG